MRNRNTLAVVIPVGPNLHDADWLGECVESVLSQTRKPDKLVVVMDKAEITLLHPTLLPAYESGLDVVVWESPWYLGVAHAFNFGVAVGDCMLSFLLGADDVLLPRCLELCEQAYWREPQKDRDLSYYWVGVRYMDGETPDQFMPCNAAMVPRELWDRTRGFPIESALGKPDSAFVSGLVVHGKSKGMGLVTVDGTQPLYLYRQHPDTESNRRRGLWHPVADAMVNTYLLDWEGRIT